jgi:predicted metal-binding membrane protein
MHDAVAPRPSARERALLWICVAAATAIAWFHLVRLHHGMAAMAGEATASPTMSMSWTPSDIAATFAMWVVMMVAMMAAPAAPVLSLYAGIQAKRPARVAGAVPMFALGYALVWIGYSALATLVQWRLHEAALLTTGMAAANGRIAGVILVAAGVYQLSPLHRACLAHCRSPLAFFMTHWRDGRSGALAMGARHGAFCLGCCWALMAVLFAVGVMNLLWVAALTLVVMLEKVAPGGEWLARVAGVLMLLAGLALLFGMP